MAKATLKPADEATTPAQASAPATLAADEVKDTKGRVIKLRSLSVIEEMRLLKILGEYNMSYYNFCAQVARVAAIDGDPIRVPNSEREIEAVGARLGREGIAALMTTVATQAVADETAEREQVKK